MSELNEMDNLPPGWECRYDDRSGRFYFINHVTRTTSWTDPRIRRIPLHATPAHTMPTEHIQMQHGSPDLRRNCVYPSHSRPIPAFQIPGQPSPKSIPLQEFRSSQRASPLSVRNNRVQDSSLTILPDPDDSVATINTMFPTVSDTHIRMLMKKYHNREALVISALQVEKNPITTPGPFATPPPQRNIHPGVHAPWHVTPPLGRNHSRGGSPIIRIGSGPNSIYAGSPRDGDGYRSSPRSHSSPKIKLRYMKSIFPDAEETLILEVLQNNENNIQMTSDILRDMGYDKKDTVKSSKQKLKAKKEEQEKQEEAKKEKEPVPEPVMKTLEEKKAIKEKLTAQYKDVAEHLVQIALESVNFDETKANQILQSMVQEDKEKEEKTNVGLIKEPEEKTEVKSPVPSTIPISQSRMSLKSLLKGEKNDKDMSSPYNRIIEDDEYNRGYRSIYHSNTRGPNSEIKKGANENLLLEDYVKWQGPNSNHTKGPQGLAKGPNKGLLSARNYTPQGPNPELRKGPKLITKGSIFSQFKTVLEGESRGK